MTPKEKAKELVGKFYINIPLRDCDNRRPHKYALIAVNYIISSNPHSNPFNTEVYSTMDYWQEVKQEIQKL